MSETLQYRIEPTADKDTVILTIHGKQFYIGKLLSEIFDLHSQNFPLDRIVASLNQRHNANLDKNFVQEVITTKIPTLTKVPTTKKATSVRSFGAINNLERFGILMRGTSFLFGAKLFYTLLSIFFLINLTFLFLLEQPVVTDIPFKTPIIILAVIFIIIIHEIGHATASYSNGIVPKEIGVGLYFIFPAFYTDLTEVWKLSKEKRVIINLAGIYYQFILNTILFILMITNISPQLNHLFFVLATVSFWLAMYNLNPFFKFDGYWVIADMFGLPNLRKQSMDLIKESFKRNFELLHDASKPLVIYAVSYLIFMSYIFYLVISFVISQQQKFWKTQPMGEGYTIWDWIVLAISILVMCFFLFRVYKAIKPKKT
ncbi:site-2 protease family protein [Sungkyunkwania multivorans]|uniref:Site-2 protease family protein n=1 Tax=Sungkyunkwania multivorans TaxID=1173618 RepID=A0ABW3CX99_9FLAO